MTISLTFGAAGIPVRKEPAGLVQKDGKRLTAALFSTFYITLHYTGVSLVHVEYRVRAECIGCVRVAAAEQHPGRDHLDAVWRQAHRQLSLSRLPAALVAQRRVPRQILRTARVLSARRTHLNRCVVRVCRKSVRYWLTDAPSNSIQIKDGCGVGQMLCFRCMQAGDSCWHCYRLHYPRRPAQYIISVAACLIYRETRTTVQKRETPPIQHTHHIHHTHRLIQSSWD